MESLLVHFLRQTSSWGRPCNEPRMALPVKAGTGSPTLLCIPQSTFHRWITNYIVQTQCTRSTNPSQNIHTECQIDPSQASERNDSWTAMTPVSPEILSQKPGTSLKGKDPSLSLLWDQEKNARGRSWTGFWNIVDWLVCWYGGPAQSPRWEPQKWCHERAQQLHPPLLQLHAWWCKVKGCESMDRAPPSAALDPGKHPPQSETVLSRVLQLYLIPCYITLWGL